VAAGWYEDPAGSSALRWWDGTQWTNHLQQTAPPPPAPVATAEPEISLSSYSPTTGYASQPRDSDWSNDQYTNRVPTTNVHHNNSIAWFALVAGIVAIAAGYLRTVAPETSYYLPVFGITATVASIRAILRYRARRVTNLWAPIIGLILGVTAEILLIVSLIAPATSAAPFVPVNVGPTGSTTNYDVGMGAPQYLPSSNATLSQATMDESKIVAILQADYANGKIGVAANGSWPSGVLHDASGDVTTSDGRDLGTLISPGWHLAYKVEGDGGFLLEVTGTNTTEVAVYDSDRNEYLAWCDTSDATCETASPVAPFTSGGTSTQAPTNS
jgi:hypothetical protein